MICLLIQNYLYKKLLLKVLPTLDYCRTHRCYRSSTLETYTVCFALRGQKPRGMPTVQSLLAAASLTAAFWGPNRLKYCKTSYTDLGEVKDLLQNQDTQVSWEITLCWCPNTGNVWIDVKVFCNISAVSECFCRWHKKGNQGNSQVDNNQWLSINSVRIYKYSVFTVSACHK